MSTDLEPIAGCVVLLGLWMVGLSQLRAKLKLYGLQGLILGLMASYIGYGHKELALILAGAAVAGLKGIVVPLYLGRVIRRIGVRRDEGLMLAPPILLLLTLGALGALLFLRPFDEDISASALPALALLLIGMILMVSRRMAISQIIGFLVMENGIFFYTVTQPHPMPLVVELGVLLDVLAGTMLAGLLAFRIRDSFEHIDVTEMRQLRG